jgi:phosphoadenosine phosphosulfate reductase
MDMLVRIEPEARFFTLDTGLFFDETYATWERVERHYGVKVDVFQGMSLARQAHTQGPELWKTNPDLCCDIRKANPLAEALADADAWVSGLRREQSSARAATRKLHWDPKHSLWKGNPLADWSEEDVWEYIDRHEVPYHPLHERGFASIGCTHCTKPAEGREGRWPGSEKTECGLHEADPVADAA